VTISILGAFCSFLENLQHLQAHCIICRPLSMQITVKRRIPQMKYTNAYETGSI